MKWNPGDELNNIVVKYDGWIDLPIIEAPRKPGVFVLVSNDMEIQFIGIASDDLLEEIQKTISLSPAAKYYSWYETSSENDAVILGRYWTSKYNSPNNI